MNINVNDLPLTNILDNQPDFFLGYSGDKGLMRVAMSRLASELFATLALPGAEIYACVFGDSNVRLNNRTITPTSVSWANGLATWTTTAHNFYTGQPIYISGTSTPLRGFAGRTTVTRINSATEFVTPVPPGATTAVGVNVSANMLSVADEPALVDGWMAWANAYAGGRINWVRNGALGGERLINVSYTQSAVDRVDDEFTGINAQVCFIMHGTNDCNDATGTARSILEIYQALLACAQKILFRHKMVPIILTIPPFGSGIANFATVQARANALNALIKSNAGIATGYLCIDTAQYLTNWNGGAAYATPPVLQPDNIHISKIGNRIVGKAIADRLGKFAPADFLSVSSIDNFGANPQLPNLIDSGIWTTTGGTVTGSGLSGTLPANWALARLDAGTLSTCVASVVARTVAADGDTNGQNIRLVMTSAAEAFNPWIRCTDTIHSRLVIGGEYEIRVPIRFTGLLGSRLRALSVWMQVNFVDPASAFAHAYNHMAFNNATTTEDMEIGTLVGNLPSADGTYMFRSLPMRVTVPVGVAGNQFNIRFLFNGAAGSALTVDMGRPAYVRVR
jgi:lysophospholipase L1-like esterase